MRQKIAVVVLSKFLSVAGLGLLSSSAYTLSYATLPSLLALASTADALPAVRQLRRHVVSWHRTLVTATGALLAFAWLSSPRYARHPYLIYTGFTVGLGAFGVPKILLRSQANANGQNPVLSLLNDDNDDAFLLANDLELAEQGEGRGRSGAATTHSGRGVINGEVVRESVDNWRKLLRWQSVAWGIGWAMGTVGLWGDGY